MPKIISLHDVLEPVKQALSASRDVIISSQICGSNLQTFFTLGDGCWLPKRGCANSGAFGARRIMMSSTYRPLFMTPSLSLLQGLPSGQSKNADALLRKPGCPQNMCRQNWFHPSPLSCNCPSLGRCPRSEGLMY